MVCLEPNAHCKLIVKSMSSMGADGQRGARGSDTGGGGVMDHELNGVVYDGLVAAGRMTALFHWHRLEHTKTI